MCTYVCTCRHGRGCAHVQALCAYKQARVCACICRCGCGCAHVRVFACMCMFVRGCAHMHVWVCVCAGLDVSVHMCSHCGTSWRFRTEGNVVLRVQAEWSYCLSSGTKAGTRCCPNGRASRMNTLLRGTWALVKLRFSALGSRLSLDRESGKLDSVQQVGANVFRKYPSQREMPK